MINFISNLFLPKPLKSYHNLSDNLVESGDYEIRKLINGPVDGVFFIKDSNILLVQSSKYLWKINEDGHVIDSMKRQGDMYSSGLCLKKDSYIDWVLTGDKTEKKYSEIINASEMTEGELRNRLDSADLVEFNHIMDSDRNWHDACFLKQKDCVIILELADDTDRIDVNCDTPGVTYGDFDKIGWYQTCLKGYEKKYDDSLVVLEHQSIESWPGGNGVVTFQKFTRNFYQFEEGFLGWLFGNILGRTILASLPGSPPSSYWFGDGYFQLSYNSEKFNFKAFTCNENKPVDFHNLLIYELPKKHFSDMMIIGISYRRNSSIKNEKRLNRYYEKDIGLYAIRKKTNLTSRAPSASGKNSTTLE